MGFALLCFFLWVLPLWSQDQGQALPLKEILIAIEQQHNVTFNYIEQEIIVFNIPAPNPSTTIEQKSITFKPKPS
ncbi:hypothetical protein H9X57_05730 [Flavobacterium piscinae]|uniref:hypothetical protein n=1 Tax=Flavobacterium piscinae TaxID=2506424 RepID=UPI0019CB4CBE|nr:hypothetical protein [Flavobacterium piscinae]MBC8883070.1 hypothetical protein [Flavobacterium piscinae]